MNHTLIFHSDHIAIVETLIANGADVNRKERKGKSPLHRAALFSSKNSKCLH